MRVRSNAPLRDLPEDYCPPGSHRWFTIPTGHDAGKTLFYYDHTTGAGPVAETVLLVHGNPECSYTFRHTRDALLRSGAALRIIAVDHIGFGLSDQASFEMIDMHHAANLATLIEHLDLRDVTLVVHDWGGPIGIGAFLKHLDRVGGLVVLNSTIFPLPPGGLGYHNFPWWFLPWYRVPLITPDALWGAVAAGVILHPDLRPLWGVARRILSYGSRFAMRQIHLRTPAAVFSEHLRSSANARSSKRNVYQTRVWGHGYRYTDSIHGVQDNHDFYQDLQTAVPDAWRDLPSAGHFGAHCPLGQEQVITQWTTAFPSMHVIRHPDQGHFVEEGKGPEIADTILRVSRVP